MPTLDWIAKDKIINHHLEVPFCTLKHLYNINCQSDCESNNLVIHGDNLFALKSLLCKYENRIDCVYIDPPYNTGTKAGQWVYSDNVDDPRIQQWLGKIVGDEEDDLSRHDKWLCMIYPRLKLLRKLLNDSGVILISIDDHEYSNLKTICDEIFGKTNFICNFIWYTEGHTDNQDIITGVHEYILCYAKNKSKISIQNVVDPNIPADSKILRSFAENSITKNGYKNPPSYIDLPIGFPCESEKLFKGKHEHIEELIEEAAEVGFITRELTKKYNMSYPARVDDMIVENYSLKSPCKVFSGWMNNAKLKQFIENNFNPITDKDGSTVRFYLSKNGVLYYRREGRTPHYIQTVLQNMGTTETNKYFLEKLGMKFDYPKPVELIKFLLSAFTKKNSIVLDCFAGSGTTGQAVLELNKEDGFNRSFILCEMMDYCEDVISQRLQKVINGNDALPATGGSFSFYELGEKVFLEDGNINNNISAELLNDYVWYSETKTGKRNKNKSDCFLGVSRGVAYYFFLYKNEISTLNHELLRNINVKADSYIIYADVCLLSEEELLKYHIVFKKIPRDITKF